MKNISAKSLNKAIINDQVSIVDMRHDNAQKKVSFSSSIPYQFEMTKGEIKKFINRNQLFQELSCICFSLIEHLNRHCIKQVLIISESGGIRQNTLASYIEFNSIKIMVLEGGMVSLLKEIETYQYKISNLKVLTGFSGSGKSKQLLAYEKMGKQVICRHRMAKHRGSVFGSLDDCQPTNEQFQLDLFLLIEQLEVHKPTYVEWEPEHLGSITIPRGFLQCYKDAELCWINLPLEERIERLIEEYSEVSSQTLLAQFDFIALRFNRDEQQIIIQSILDRDFKILLSLLLPYFDRAYETMYQRFNKSLVNQNRLDY